MYAANSYVLRLATDADAPMLSRLADLDGTGAPRGIDPHRRAARRAGRGPRRCATTAAISDPFKPTAHLLATMRRRADGMRAVEEMPSLRDRLIAGLPLTYRARPARGA